MTQYLFIFGAFLLSMICGIVSIPIIIRFCKEKGLYDLPNSRKVHHNAIPRLGGISFIPSMTLASLIVFLVHNQILVGNQLHISLWTVGFFFSLFLIYGVGIVDDLVGLGAKTKFSMQIIASMVMPICGLYINDLYGFCGIHEVPFWFGAIFTLYIVVFISNSINLIDGIDGLSGGLSLIALTGFLTLFIRRGDMTAYCIMIAGLMGVLVAFIYFNLFGNPEKNHKIFMGDSGSLTLGYVLGFLAVKSTMNDERMEYDPSVMMYAFSLIIVPVFDVVRISYVRLRQHAPIFLADKIHIHHKLMRMGLTQHQTLTTILLLAVAFIAVNHLLWYVCDFTFIVLIDIVLWNLFHIVINHRIRKQGKLVYVREEKKNG